MESCQICPHREYIINNDDIISYKNVSGGKKIIKKTKKYNKKIRKKSKKYNKKKRK